MHLDEIDHAWYFWVLPPDVKIKEVDDAKKIINEYGDPGRHYRIVRDFGTLVMTDSIKG